MKAAEPSIVVLAGADSPEREVSLRSAKAVVDSLEKFFPAQLCVLDRNELGSGWEPSETVIFPVIHGVYGEDGGVQRDLDMQQLLYAGCDARSSALCMNKEETKAKVSAVGVPVLPHVCFDAGEKHDMRALLGERLVVKPVDQGSSVGLHLLEGEDIAPALNKLTSGRWMAEPWIVGVELTVGILAGKALEVVAIRPKGGVYDYQHKYTPGMTAYEVPARISDGMRSQLQQWSEAAFSACGCRDFARADFIYEPQRGLYFLEINTMPGMTETSLLPKSASAVGMNFDELVQAMLQPALARWSQLYRQVRV